ncbi:tRNA adenine58-N1-methyltransferase non-catalytic subunit trm6 [Hondaea fermentalgiana]|uniref:tRNA (adenine(58)-N(1))-methyltransferase non-catalytic subunit TRM6 n=1 Tax=Hondaea fermentalgiana TaxID=2315210 RepID=A0A2R5GEX1_9STRA|nr:tRNA adenine58-N1-methyltransferase non-catalytic subunit trm6 [Hondaea fermentalgiana]|eukprot:GBG29470.1 tRNA adenine58-N1-methyltransferase non-catalytic subunit trm6 [Hondaea fermentalgiana]
MPVNQCTIMTEGLIGLRIGECFDLKPLEPEARLQAFAKSIFMPRFVAEKEKKFTIMGKVYKDKGGPQQKKQKKQGEDTGTSADAETDPHPKWALYRPVRCANTVGLLPDASMDELTLRRTQLLEALNEVEDDLGMTRTKPADEEASTSNAKMRTNEHLIDIAGRKQPSAEEMGLMRATMTEQEIVDQLQKANENFGEKTEYSQEKFRREKMLKHSRKMRVLPTNAITIAATLWSSIAETGMKFANFRARDVLPQILAMANVQAGSRPLLVESTEGLLTGAILERLAGHGRLYCGHFDTGWSDLRMLHFFNPSPTEIATLREVNLSEVLQDFSGEEPLTTLQTKLERLYEHKGKLEQRLAALDDSNADDATVSAQRADLKKNLRAIGFTIRGTRNKLPTKEADARENVEVYSELKNAQATSLILASKYDIKRSFFGLLKFLKPGAPFVVFSEAVDPLVQLREQANNKVAVGMAIQETFCREQQVLPSRTHPLMSMSGRSGFLLSGHKVDPDAEEGQLVHVKVNKLAAYKEAVKSERDPRAAKDAARRATQTSVPAEVSAATSSSE